MLVNLKENKCLTVGSLMNVVEGCDAEEGGGPGAHLWLLKTLLVGAAKPLIIT